MKLKHFYFLIAFFTSQSLQANLLVTPTRVELDNLRERSAVFSLVNKGSTTSRYEVYFEEKRMLASGEFVTLSKDTNTQVSTALSPELIAQMQEGSIAKYVRYSPRRLSLEPEQGGRVRLALRVPKNLAAGEYRSYIVFHQIPLAPVSTNSAAQQQHNQSLNLTISAYMKIAIPVILRIGALSANVELNLGKLEMSDGSQSLEVTLHRQGERSSYGDLEVLRASNNEVIGSLKNAAVYTELNEKLFTVPLTQEVKPGTELIIRFSESDSLFEAKKIETRLSF